MDHAMNCLRCGDFQEASVFAVSGIPYCVGCVERENAEDMRALILPPKSVALRRLAFLSLGFLPGALLGALASLFFGSQFKGAEGVFLFMFTMLGGSLSEIIFFGFGFSRLQHIGSELWKRKLVRELGIEVWAERADLRIDLSCIILEKPSWFRMKLPMEIGLVVSNASGLLFLGSKGKRFSLNLPQLFSVTTERWQTWPPRTALRFELTTAGRAETRVGGGLVYLAFMDEPSFQANKEKAEARREEFRALLRPLHPPAPSAL